MLNIVLKGGFSCHPGDLSRKCHLCHGLCESRKQGTRTPYSHCKTVRNIFDGDQIAIYQSLLLFLGLTYRASPPLWDKYWIISRWLTAYSRCCIDCGNSYTLRSFMLMKCHCLFVTSNSKSNRPLFLMFSVTLACMLVRSVSVALPCPSDWLYLVFLQLLVTLVPSGATFKISDTRPIFSWNFYSYQPGAGSLC